MNEEKNAYSGFAKLYDAFMEDIPYGEWLSCVTGFLREAGITDGLVLELGCGTGTMTELLAEQGYDMIGVDNSPEMLEEAMKKRDLSGLDILYLLQDMREFELYGTVRAILSVCDSMNYITEEEDLKQVFSLADNYLDPGGIFIFDMKTAYFYREELGEATFSDTLEQGTYIWENYWEEEENVNEYDLTFFLKRPDGLYEKQTETHLQRAYETERIAALLEEAGLEVFRICDAKTLEEPDGKTERIYFLARECRKKLPL